jgi:hypothetical protein
MTIVRAFACVLCGSLASCAAPAAPTVERRRLPLSRQRRKPSQLRHQNHRQSRQCLQRWSPQSCAITAAGVALVAALVTDCRAVGAPLGAIHTASGITAPEMDAEARVGC